MTPFEFWEAWVMSVTAVWLGFSKRTSAQSEADWIEIIGKHGARQ
jgi:hypothetical protein